MLKEIAVISNENNNSCFDISVDEDTKDTVMSEIRNEVTKNSQSNKEMNDTGIELWKDQNPTKAIISTTIRNLEYRIQYVIDKTGA
jgi:hypothetical protein